MTRRSFKHLNPTLCRTLLFLRQACYAGSIGLAIGLPLTLSILGSVPVGAMCMGSVCIICVIVILLAMSFELLLFIFFIARYSLRWFLTIFLLTNALIACLITGPKPLSIAAGFGLFIWIIVLLTAVTVEFPSKSELEDVLNKAKSNSGAAI